MIAVRSVVVNFQSCDCNCRIIFLHNFLSFPMIHVIYFSCSSGNSTDFRQNWFKPHVRGSSKVSRKESSTWVSVHWNLEPILYCTVQFCPLNLSFTHVAKNEGNSFRVLSLSLSVPLTSPLTPHFTNNADELLPSSFMTKVHIRWLNYVPLLQIHMMSPLMIIKDFGYRYNMNYEYFPSQ